jgi:hypothetical protein
MTDGNPISWLYLRGRISNTSGIYINVRGVQSQEYSVDPTGGPRAGCSPLLKDADEARNLSDCMICARVWASGQCETALSVAAWSKDIRAQRGFEFSPTYAQ